MRGEGVTSGCEGGITVPVKLVDVWAVCLVDSWVVVSVVVLVDL